MGDGNNDGGTNTILIVIVILAVVGFGVWWITTNNAKPSGADINITLPTSN